MFGFGGNYGIYGGQAAGNEATGFQQGWGFVENVIDAHVNRKIKQEQWELEARKRREELYRQGLKDAALYNAYKSANWTPEVTKQKIQQAEQQNKRMQGEYIKKTVVDTAIAPDPKKGAEVLQARAKQYPDLAAKVGINPNAGIRASFQIQCE